MYLLDTNIVSDLIRNPAGAVSQKVAQVGQEQIVTSIIVAAELKFGAEKRGSPKLSGRVDSILARLPVLAFGDGDDLHYAKVRIELENKGEPIGSNDMLIAAQTLSQGAILVTDNVKEFQKITNLKVENWLR